MKKLAISFLCLLSLAVGTCSHSATRTIQLMGFGDLVDVVEPDLLQQKYSPDMLNVITDDLGVIRKRTGSELYAAPLTGLQSVRKMYMYNLTSGRQYIICNSSNSCFANTTGNSFSAIVSGLDSNYTDSYATVDGVLYRDNGSGSASDPLGGKWDGTTYTSFTVANTTSMVTGRYIQWWHNRLWKAGVTGSENFVYYSEVARPDDFNVLGVNYIRVNVNDGDIITSLIVGAGDKLYVTKRESTWEIIENSAGSFVLKLISPSIGCIYNTTVSILQGYPIWMSRRGIEQFNGSNFTLISAPIDNFVRALPQLASGVGYWTNTNSADFGEGQGVTIDTTTTPGSVKIQATNNQINQRQEVKLGTDIAQLSGISVWQTFRSSYTLMVSTVAIKVWRVLACSDSAELTLQLQDYNRTIISSITIAAILISTKSVSENYQWAAFNFANTHATLTAEATYYIVVTATATDTFRIPRNTDATSYPRGELYKSDISLSLGDMLFRVYQFMGDNKYAQYQSKVKDLNSDWVQWDRILADYSATTGSSIKWYVSVATASVLCSSNNLVAVTTGAVIPSSTGGYIMYFASMSTNDIGVIPQIDEVTIKYLLASEGSPTQPAVGTTYKDRYYVFFTTDPGAGKNNASLCYQKDSGWALFNSINVLSSCIYLNKLYTGSSLNDGNILEMFKDNVYSDNGVAYPAYYETKPLDFENPLSKKWLKDIYLTTDNSGHDITLSIRLDGNATWTNYTIPTTSNGTILKTRLPIPFITKAYNFSIRVGNNNAGEHFKVMRMSFDVEDLPIE